MAHAGPQNLVSACVTHLVKRKLPLAIIGLIKIMVLAHICNQTKYQTKLKIYAKRMGSAQHEFRCKSWPDATKLGYGELLFRGHEHWIRPLVWSTHFSSWNLRFTQFQDACLLQGVSSFIKQIFCPFQYLPAPTAAKKQWQTQTFHQWMFTPFLRIPRSWITGV